MNKKYFILLILLIVLGVFVLFWFTNGVSNPNQNEDADTNSGANGQQSSEPFLFSNEEQAVENNLSDSANPSITEVETLSADNLLNTIIVYTPAGLFSESEKDELQEKLINPYLDWHDIQLVEVVTFNIEKSDIEGYAYKVSFVNKDGSNGGFLFGTESPLEWWVPDCMDGCDLPQEYKDKYPKIAEKSI